MKIARIVVAWLLLCGRAFAVPASVQPPVTAGSTSLAPYMHAPNPTVWSFGDSRIGIASIYQTVGTPHPYSAKQPASVLGWAQRFLGDRVNWDMAHGYTGTAGVAFKVVITAGGSGYSASSTCSSNGGLTYGPPSTDTNGAITAIPLLAGGAGLTSTPNLTCTGGSGLNAVAVIGGSGSFGNSGETSCQGVSRLGDLEAVAQPGDIVFIRTGTNDETAGYSLTQSTACMKSIFDRLLGDGYYVIYQEDGARLAWGAASDATAPAPQYRKQMYARRRWVQQYRLNDAAKNTNGYPHFSLIDTFPEVSDTTSPYGDPKANYTADGLHDSQRSAYIGGWKLAQVLSSLLPAAPGVLGNTSCADTFDAVYNPAGPVNVNPCLSGTTGGVPASAGGLTFSGTTPTGYTLATSGTTGTQTVTAGVEATRTDGLNGARPQITVSCGAGGSAVQTYSLKMPANTSFASLGYTSATNGSAQAPKIRLDVDVEVSGQLSMNTLQAYLAVFDTGSLILTGSDGAGASTATASIGDTGANDGLVPSLGTGTIIHLSTPTLVLNNIGTVAGTQVQVSGTLTWGFNCSGATAGAAGGTVKINRISVHPVS